MTSPTGLVEMTSWAGQTQKLSCYMGSKRHGGSESTSWSLRRTFRSVLPQPFAIRRRREGDDARSSGLERSWTVMLWMTARIVLAFFSASLISVLLSLQREGVKSSVPELSTPVLDGPTQPTASKNTFV